MQELITLIVQSLVKQPEAVSVTMEVRDQVEVYESVSLLMIWVK